MASHPTSDKRLQRHTTSKGFRNVTARERHISAAGPVHNRTMPTEKQLLDRIRELEEQNSALQDKLDMIYAILAPDYEEGEEEPGFVQIEGFRGKQQPD